MKKIKVNKSKVKHYCMIAFITYYDWTAARLYDSLIVQLYNYIITWLLNLYNELTT